MALIRKPMAYVSLTHAWALVRDGVRRVRLTCTGRAEDGTSCNVVGELPGSDSSSRVVAVAGHMDSVSVGVGADDDASGVVAMLECARRLRERPRQNAARFIGFGAEEQLSVGSARYMLEQVTDTDRLAFVCNFDGIAAHAGMSSVMCTGTRGLEEFVRRIIVERLQFGEVHSDVCPYQDQFWFTAKGIPGIWMTRKTHLNGYWYHHSIHNDLSAVSMEQIAWTAEAACELMKPLLAASKWPFPRRIPAALMTRIDRYTREIF
jgi:Zn-dependent M28 family amino/carboxypeptidase